MYMRKKNNGSPTYLKTQEKSSPQRQRRLPILQKTYDPKTLHILATGAEEDEEQEDMAYIGLVAISAPYPGPQHNLW